MNCFYCGIALEKIRYEHTPNANCSKCGGTGEFKHLHFGIVKCPCNVHSMIGNWVRDHMMPKSRGGSNRKDNLADCCFTCNSQKGRKTVEEYRAYLEIYQIKKNYDMIPISKLQPVVFFGEAR